MVIQVNERKPGNDDEREASFESKYMIQTGNYVKFGTTVDTIFRNIHLDKFKRSIKPPVSKSNDAFYEIINKTGSNKSLSDSTQLLNEEDKLSMWIDSKDLYCSCPKIRLRRKYLIMSKSSNLLKYLNTETKEIDHDDEEVDDIDEEDEIRFSYDKAANSSRVIQSRDVAANSTQRADVRKVATEASGPVVRVAGVLVDRDTSIVEWRPNYARRLRRFIRYYQSGKCS